MKKILLPRDRGVALLLSLVMLAIFLTTAITFILFSGSIRSASELQKMNTSALLLSDHVLEEMRVLMENTMAPCVYFDEIPVGYTDPYKTYWNSPDTAYTPQAKWGAPTIAGELEDGTGTKILDIQYTGRPTNISNVASGVDMVDSVRKALTFNFAGDTACKIANPAVGWISAAKDAPNMATGTDSNGYFYYSYAIIPIENQYNPNLYGPPKSSSSTTDTRVHGANISEIPISHFYESSSSVDFTTLQETHWESMQHLQSEFADDTALSVWFPDVAEEAHFPDNNLAWDQSSILAKPYLNYDNNDTTKVSSYAATFNAADPFFDLKTASANSGSDANKLVFNSSDATNIFGRLRYLRMPYKTNAADKADDFYFHPSNAKPSEGNKASSWARDGFVAGYHALDPRVASTAVYANLNDFMDADSLPTTTRNLKADFEAMTAEAFDWSKDGVDFYTYLNSVKVGDGKSYLTSTSGVADGLAGFQHFAVGLEAVPYFRQLKAKVTRTSSIIDTNTPGQQHSFTVDFNLETANMYPQGVPAGCTARVKMFYSFSYDNQPRTAADVAGGIAENQFPTNYQKAYGMIETTSPTLSTTIGARSTTTFSATISSADYTCLGDSSVYSNNICGFQAIAVVMIVNNSGDMLDWSVTPPLRCRGVTATEGKYFKNKFQKPAGTTIKYPDSLPTEAVGASTTFDITGASTYLWFSWEAVDPRCNNYVYKPASTKRYNHKFNYRVKTVSTKNFSDSDWDLVQDQDNSHYPGAYDYITSRFSWWDLAVQSNGSTTLKARSTESTTGAPSFIGTDPNVRPWDYLSAYYYFPQDGLWTVWETNEVSDYTDGWKTLQVFDYAGQLQDNPDEQSSNTMPAGVTHGDKLFVANGYFKDYNPMCESALTPNKPLAGLYLSYQGLLVDVERYMQANKRVGNGTNSWTAQISTAYIKNSSFSSLKEMGLIGRGECFKTLNLTMGGTPHDGGSYSEVTLGFGPWLNIHRFSSGTSRGCNDRTLMHYLKFGDTYKDDDYVRANFLNVYEKNPLIIKAYLRDCYSANPRFNDPDYTDDSNGRIPDARAYSATSFFPTQWQATESGKTYHGWNSWSKYMHTFNLRQATETGKFTVFPGCPGLGNILEAAQVNTFTNESNLIGATTYLFDAQAEGLFTSNYRLVGPGHRYFLSVFNIRHTQKPASAAFDPEDYDSQVKMVVLFERITPALDTAPVSSRIISKQLIME